MADGSNPAIEIGSIRQPEVSQETSVIVPRKIEGIVGPIQQESLGGNAGHMGVALNAIYAGTPNQEFIFTNKADNQFGRPKDVTFRFQFPEHLVTYIKQGKTPPPALITDVLTDAQGDRKALFERRATEHNTAEILEYLKKGGKIQDLYSTPTPFVPGAKEINRLLAEALKDQITPDPRRQRKIIAYGLTRAKGTFNFQDVPITEITQREYGQFMAYIKSGVFTRRNLDEMLALIPESKRRQEYADQFELFRKASGVTDEVFEGNQTGV